MAPMRSTTLAGVVSTHLFCQYPSKIDIAAPQAPILELYSIINLLCASATSWSRRDIGELSLPYFISAIWSTSMRTILGFSVEQLPACRAITPSSFPLGAFWFCFILSSLIIEDAIFDIFCAIPLCQAIRPHATRCLLRAAWYLLMMHVRIDMLLIWWFSQTQNATLAPRHW